DPAASIIPYKNNKKPALIVGALIPETFCRAIIYEIPVKHAGIRVLWFTIQKGVWYRGKGICQESSASHFPRNKKL
ncbi:hypothetical protein SAMN02745216_05308, partial [Desulfatibacillum alkenivorans DSM 16219]